MQQLRRELNIRYIQHTTSLYGNILCRMADCASVQRLRCGTGEYSIFAVGDARPSPTFCQVRPLCLLPDMSSDAGDLRLLDHLVSLSLVPSSLFPPSIYGNTDELRLLDRSAGW